MDEQNEPTAMYLFIQALEEIMKDLQPLLEKLKAWQDDFERCEPGHAEYDLAEKRQQQRQNVHRHLLPSATNGGNRKDESFQLTHRKTGRR